MKTNSQVPQSDRIYITTVEAQTMVSMMHTAKTINAELVVILNHADRYVSVALDDNCGSVGVVVSEVNENGDLVEVKRFDSVENFAAFFEV